MPKKSRASYFEKLKDPRWQKKRLEVLERSSWTCMDCFSKDKPLHVHHCFYEYGKEPWDYDFTTLTTLCEECHENRQDLERDAKLALGRILKICNNDPSHQESSLKRFVFSLMNNCGMEMDLVSPVIIENFEVVCMENILNQLAIFLGNENIVTDKHLFIENGAIERLITEKLASLT